MSKRTAKYTQNPVVEKTAKHQRMIQGPYSPKIAQSPNLDLPIAWNFGRMDKGGKFKCTLEKLNNHAKEVVALEGKTISQLLEKTHNHPMPIDKLSLEARKRVADTAMNIETFYQLDLKTPVRLWGVVEHNIFHIIWLDPEHGVYKIR